MIGKRQWRVGLFNTENDNLTRVSARANGLPRIKSKPDGAPDEEMALKKKRTIIELLH